MSLLEAIPGESLIGDALKTQLRGKPIASGTMSIEQMIEACAHIAATLHTSGIQLGRRRTFVDELELTPEATRALIEQLSQRFLDTYTSAAGKRRGAAATPG